MSEAVQATGGTTPAADATGVSTAPGRSCLDPQQAVTNGRQNHGTRRRSTIPHTDILGPLYEQESATTAGFSQGLLSDGLGSLVKFHGGLPPEKVVVTNGTPTRRTVTAITQRNHRFNSNREIPPTPPLLTNNNILLRIIRGCQVIRPTPPGRLVGRRRWDDG